MGALPKTSVKTTTEWWNIRFAQQKAEREAKEKAKKKFVEGNFSKIEKLVDNLKECGYRIENALVRMDYGKIVGEFDDAQAIGNEGLEIMDGLKGD